MLALFIYLFIFYIILNLILFYVRFLLKRNKQFEDAT